jgi:hypothetical protein
MSHRIDDIDCLMSEIGRKLYILKATISTHDAIIDNLSYFFDSIAQTDKLKEELCQTLDELGLPHELETLCVEELHTLYCKYVERCVSNKSAISELWEDLIDFLNQLHFDFCCYMYPVVLTDDEEEE